MFGGACTGNKERVGLLLVVSWHFQFGLYLVAAVVYKSGWIDSGFIEYGLFDFPF